MSVYDAEINKVIEKTALELKKVSEVKPPEWSKFVKTGPYKERPPESKDWWYMRSASVLNKIYKYGPIGVSKLRTKYGGKKNRGHKPERFYRGSGNIIRKILQQLEKSGLIIQAEKDVRKGRKMTPKGKSFLDKMAK